jgi:hypothetical protein
VSVEHCWNDTDGDNEITLVIILQCPFCPPQVPKYFALERNPVIHDDKFVRLLEICFSGPALQKAVSLVHLLFQYNSNSLSSISMANVLLYTRNSFPKIPIEMKPRK